MSLSPLEKTSLLNTTATALRRIYRHFKQQKKHQNNHQAQTVGCKQCRLRSHISFFTKVKHPEIFKKWCLLLLSKLGHHFPQVENNYIKKPSQTTNNSAPCAAASRLSRQASVEKAAREWKSGLFSLSQKWGLVISQLQSVMQGTQAGNLHLPPPGL